jgi:TolB-like protein/Flp pilus assembly protein TadD
MAPYTSPEELAGKPREHRSEMYSLGVLFYEMVTGARPFSGETPDELLSGIAMNTPTPVSARRRDLPESLGRLIEWCLEKDLDRRPDSTRIVRQELARIRREHLGKDEQTGPSIAVLPFLDMSLEEDQDYLCDGITEAIINDLGDAKSLRVISRISAFQFKDSDLEVREIGRRLNVAQILKGTVKKAEGRLRVAVELYRVTDGDQIWSADYDRELEGIFDIQAEIVQSVEEILHSGGGHAQAPPTKDVQAYEYYLRGRKFYYQYRRKAAELALRMFSTAIRHDPGFALAHAGIADCCCFLYLYSEGRAENLERAETASANALELAPELAEVHASRGLALSLSKKNAEAEEEFQTALRLDPDLYQANYLYARHCFAQGKLDEAGKLFEKAAEVSPDDYQTLLLAAQVMEGRGRRQEAEALRRRGIQLVEVQLRSHPGDVRALYMGANALATLGEKERPLEWANLALVMEPTEPMVLYNAGCIYALCGKIDEAIDSLDKAARVGLSQKGWYENDTDLDSLRDHYRFKALMRRL